MNEVIGVEEVLICFFFYKRVGLVYGSITDHNN